MKKFIQSILRYNSPEKNSERGRLLKKENERLQIELNQAKARLTSLSASEKRYNGLGKVSEMFNGFNKETMIILEQLFDPMSNTYSMQGLMDETTESIGELRETLSAVTGVIHDHRDVAPTLRRNVESIQSFVASIEKISMQTRMLALNAAVEAARAEEKGKGFAVVAEEVHRLSEDVTQTTQSIAGELSGINKDTKRAEELMLLLSNKVSDIEKVTLKVDETVVDTRKQTTDLQFAAYDSMVAAHILCVLLWLGKFTFEIRMAIRSPSRYNFPTIDKKENYFGEWYYNASDNEFNFRSLPEFSILGETYDELIETACQVRELVDYGETTEAEKYIPDLERYSGEIYSLLDTIRKYLIEQTENQLKNKEKTEANAVMA